MISAEEFESLFRLEYVRLYRLAYGLLHDAQESEDAVSEVFAVIWKRQPEVAEDKWHDYLSQATYHHCINVLNRKERFEALKDSYREEQRFAQKADQSERDRLKQILQYINHDMPPRMREVFSLCFGQEMSYQQAAEVMQVTTAAINKHIVNGLKLLRDKFNKETNKRSE